jgi:hypothetical protein
MVYIALMIIYEIPFQLHYIFHRTVSFEFVMSHAIVLVL